jgi:hypothetical protein
MTIGSGNLILASDYNTIQNRVAVILGTGGVNPSGGSDATYGYGQSPASSQVTAGNSIAASHMINLKADLESLSIHQTGAVYSPALTTIAAGGTISASDWTAYSNAAVALESSRFTAAGAQMSLSASDLAPTTSNWNGTVTHIFTATFGSANAARAFFNAGGEIRINPSNSIVGGGTKGGAWGTLLDSFRPVRFNYTNTTASAGTGTSIGWYDLTNSYQTIFSIVDSGTYSGNDVQVSALCDVANNSGGTATVLTIRIQYNDDGIFGTTPPGDENVNGTLTSTIQNLRPLAATPPAGATVTVSAPSFSTTTWP